MTNSQPPQRLLTPSKVTAWLDCAHYLTLKHREERGEITVPRGRGGDFVQLLMDKGMEHERACLEEYRRSGKSVVDVPQRGHAESFASWVDRVGDVMAEGADVIYQMPFVHDGMRGIADFLLRCDLPDGRFTYEPLDAKLARSAAKPGHVLQLCFYADAIEAAGRPAPQDVHVWLGSGTVELIHLDEVRAYWRRLRVQLRSVMEAAPEDATTTPVKCDHCTFCEFVDLCTAEWRAADSLQFVAGIRAAERQLLEAGGVPTMASLAAFTAEVPDLGPARRARLTAQAELQVRARELPEGSVPPHLPLPDPTPEEEQAGLVALPLPDDGDVFLDYEGHPFWRADAGLFFLFGLLTKGDDGEWAYEARWAHSKVDEGAQAAGLIEYLADRRRQRPAMHVYHYNHTERSALESMATEHGADQSLLQDLVEGGLFVDLLPIVRNSLQAGVESYGLKSMERLAGYERGHDIDRGAGAVVEYERWTHDHNGESLAHIAAYNEDDVRATQVLRDWLVGRRDPSAVRRPAAAPREKSDKRKALDELVASLHARGEGTIEQLMGDLLGYWGREGAANTAQLLAKVAPQSGDLLDDPLAIAGLHSAEQVQLLTPTGRPAKHGGLVLRFPPQEVGQGLHPGGPFPPSVCYAGQDGVAGWADVVDLDVDGGTITLQWKAASQELGIIPTQVVLNEWVDPGVKRGVLEEIAHAVDQGDVVDGVQMALLSAAPPRFCGPGPAGGEFNDDIDDAMRWVLGLDRSCVPIQGPPGTGKTWTGAHLGLALAQAGKRVGVTAMSHHAIDNFLREVIDVFTEAGSIDILSVARVGAKDSTPNHPAVQCVDNGGAGSTDFNLIAGTTWAFASAALRNSPVDVLIIDEAGQLGLADALAASSAAGSVVLLGDPLQLPQVAQASHPRRSGMSVLEHMIGAGVATVPPDRGVFLTTTRRMHPDVCRFISDEIYEGRLVAHDSCGQQGTAQGTGLRWLRATHAGCSTESRAEAELVAARVRALLGQPWRDAKGTSRPLTGEDFMVVAPYNDQVRLMRTMFDEEPALNGVKVGTVDKFQGQQAPVVFFTMTTSTSDDMPRGPGFLFSRNRLNVALSRAKCLAYVVCTEELLNSRARTIDEMRLISTLCAAVDCASVREDPLRQRVGSPAVATLATAAAQTSDASI